MTKLITELASIGTVDGAADVLEITDVSANTSNKTTRNQLLGITGAPVGTTDSQSISNKTIGNTNSVTALDSLLVIQSNSDQTKQAVFNAGSITTATTRTYTLPNRSDTLVTLAGTETLTNKTLTSPTIATPTITNASITADSISGFSSANNGTIYGLSVTSGQIGTSGIVDDAITAAKIDWASTGANGGIWWEELGRTTLSSAGDTISVTSIPARTFLKVIAVLGATGGVADAGLRFNNDSAANYSERFSSNGGADSTTTGGAQLVFRAGALVVGGTGISVGEIVNFTSQEKIISWQAGGTVTATGAATAPGRIEGAGKWANTASQITRIDVINFNVGDFAIGSTVVVLGHN